MENVSISESLHTPENLIRLMDMYLNSAKKSAMDSLKSDIPDMVGILVNLKKAIEIQELLKQHLK